MQFCSNLFLMPPNYLCALQDECSRLSWNASLGVHGYILVFSIASRQSFEMIRQVNDLLLNALGDAPDVPRVLVGSMKDLADQRQVSHLVRCTGGDSDLQALASHVGSD